MTRPHTPLPPEIEAVIRAVLEAAELEMTEGREDVHRELRAHFEDGLSSGATPAEMIERFGDPVIAGRKISRTMPRAAARSRGENGRWWMRVGEWRTELVRAIRRLGRAPGFMGVVVLTLALGVGVNTAIFTVLNAVLLQDLPYENPERLVRVYETYEDWGQVEYMRGPAVVEFRQWDEVFEDLAAMYTYREVGADLTDGDAPRRVSVLQISAGYFETLGRAPLLGRTFEEHETYGVGEAREDEELPLIGLLSHSLWSSHFGQDPEILGKTMTLDGSSLEIVGVMPASFRDPVGPQAMVWVPQDLRLGESNDFGNFYLSGIARLRDGITIDAAQERLRALSAAMAERIPEMGPTIATILPLQGELVGQTRTTMLWILAAAAGLVLLTACVNVANLLFARGLSQDRSLALRSALGSGRGRLVASILLENGILAGLGGALGLGLGWIGLQALLGVAPAALPGVTEIAFGIPVFSYALGITAAALLIFGLTPAMRMSRTAPADVLRSGDRATTAGRGVRRFRNALVVLQVAAALVLVTGAALLTRSFNSLLDVPLAVDAENVLTFEVHLPTARYPEPVDRVRFHDDFQAAVRSLPGVEAVAATSWLPANGRYHSWGMYYDPENTDFENNDEGWANTDVRTIHGDYFEAMGIRLVRGQQPSEVDLEAEQVVWVNEEVVESLMPDADPLGERIWAAGEDRRIAGVVASVPWSPRGDVSRKIYVPHRQADSRNWALIQTVRSGGDLAQLRDALEAELGRIDSNLVLYRVQSFPSVLSTVRAQDRFATLLMGAFGFLALTLSLVGTYGVLSGTVAARTREIGIRMALGADAESVQGMILRYAARLTVPGVLLGVFLAWIAGRWIQALLYGVAAADPVSYGVAIALFSLTGLLAGWLPARRATRVDAVEVLGVE